MEREMITIPKGGRPKKVFPPYMLETMKLQREYMKIREMAEYYEVSLATMKRWLKEAGCTNVRSKDTKS